MRRVYVPSVQKVGSLSVSLGFVGGLENNNGNHLLEADWVVD